MAQSGHFEIMQPVGNNAYTFTVNNAIQTVPLVAPISANPFFQDAGGASIFPNGDNINVLSFGIRLPFCFHFGDGTPSLLLNWMDPITHGQIVFQNPLNGLLFFPLADTDIELGFFERHPGVFNGNIALQINYQLLGVNIDMTGVPNSFNGQSISVYPWLKLLHTISLT